ncbi:hypothetical protein LXL04_029161 [Taraxacum kok-saghyz]
MEEIKSATSDFNKNNVIGKGGFGIVYKGVLVHSKGKSMVAFKRLDRKYGQGDPEFLKEIVMLSRYTHENLISLLGFCDNDGEKILVYEYASHGSLDRHLEGATLMWRQRLKICLDAAKGLCYLHDSKGTQQRVIHRDIKASNILLDENWNAKISDMGLSKIGPADQPHSFLATNVVGTPGYIDPVYMETYSLTKESDVYSFGMVLFEVLCGRLCFEYNNGHFKSLWPMWRKSYEENKLDEIILEKLKQQISQNSLQTFSRIAYRCLHRSREERPKMSHVVEELETALLFQQMEQPVDNEEMGNTVVPSLVSKGFMVNEGKTWLWINKNGEYCELISAEECLIPTVSASSMYTYDSRKKSRFGADYDINFFKEFKIHVRTQFLTPHITYAVNLVFDSNYISYTRTLYIDYTLAGEREPWTSNVLDTREDGWFTTELYQFTSDRRCVELDITFSCMDEIGVEGIEFQPVERHLEDGEVDIQEDTYWEQKLPSDYGEIIKWSNDSFQWRTKKELYSILCEGFPIKNGEQWFSLDKNGKKCYMLSASVALHKRQWKWQSLPESRFEEVALNPSGGFWITCNSQMFPPQTTYACYLVYKIRNEKSNFGRRVQVMTRLPHPSSGKFHSWYIRLLLSETPIIGRKVNDNTPNILNTPKMKGLPRLRNDGWMEVQIWESQTGILLDLKFVAGPAGWSFKGLIVQGVEFKAI